MKGIKLIAAMLLVALTGALIGCNNNDDNNNCVADYTGALSELETALVGTWKMTAIVAKDSVDITNDNKKNPSKDIFVQQSDCQNDQIYKYNANRTFEFSSGKTKKDCKDAVTIKGSWKLDNNTLRLVFSCLEDIKVLDFNAEKTSYSIKSNVSITDVNKKAIKTQITLTYTKS